MILSVIDYAKNYTRDLKMRYRQVIGLASTTITVLVHIVYFHSIDSTYAIRNIEKVCLYYINDDKKHDYLCTTCIQAARFMVV